LIPFIFSVDSNANELAHSSRVLFIVFGPLQDIINFDLFFLKIEKNIGYLKVEMKSCGMFLN